MFFYHFIFISITSIQSYLFEFTQGIVIMSDRSVQQRNLLAACARGEYDFLEKYIPKNAQKRKYEVFDNHKWGPLHHAVASNSYDCVQLLLSSGLVDTRWKSFEGQTCLFVAVDRGASQAIVKLLLKTDADLFNQPNNEHVFPIHRAVIKNSLETVRTMIETLVEMRVPIVDQFDWDDENSLFLAARAKNFRMVEYLSANVKCNYQHVNVSGLNAVTVALLPCDEDVLREEWNRNEIVTKLIPLTYNASSTDFMQQMMLPISFTCLFKHREIFMWIMDEFYLTEMNEHRDLVRKSLDSFQLVAFDYQIILTSLHSKITQFIVKPNDQLKNDLLYSNIITDLHNIFKHNRDLFDQIIKVLRPKLDLNSLNYVMIKFIPSESVEGTQLLSDFVEMFDTMHIENLLNIQSLLFFTPSTIFLSNLLLLMMPFSIAPTADVYIEEGVKHKVFANPQSIEAFELDDGLARFCINGNFRRKCNLKNLCRAIIRRTILQNGPVGLKNSQRLNRIRTMQLPIPIKNFLLFNYTRYDFK